MARKRPAKIYTSYYRKMLDRHKGDNDIYIQISRSLGIPRQGVDGLYMSELLDASWGEEFGMYSDDLRDYRHDLDKDDLDSFAEMLRELNDGERVFLLCFENLNKTYTKADAEKYKNVKVGEKKKCHRTILADVLNKRYGFDIKEFEE